MEGSKLPRARYFDSAEIWGDKLIILGFKFISGGVIQNELEGTNALCTLGDICIWNSKTLEWEFPKIGLEIGLERAESRYTHLAVISTYVTNDYEQFPSLQTNCTKFDDYS